MRIIQLRGLVLIAAVHFLWTSACFAEKAPLERTPEQRKSEMDKVLEQAAWDNLSIEFRPAKETLAEGFIPMESKNASEDKTYYVSTTAEFGLKDILAMDIFYRPWMEDKIGLRVYWKKKAKEHFADYTSKHVGDFIAIVVNGELKSIAKITGSMTAGRIEIIGLIQLQL